MRPGRTLHCLHGGGRLAHQLNHLDSNARSAAGSTGCTAGAAPAGESRPTELRPASTLAQGVLFVLFTIAAFAVFAAVLLLPVVRDYNGLLAEERALRADVQRLERRDRTLKELIDAVGSDAAMNERLARAELGYTRPGETVVTVQPTRWSTGIAPSGLGPGGDSSGSSAAATGMPIVPDAWPDWAHRAEAWGWRRGLLPLFLDPTLRRIWLLMAGGMVVAAFVLFAPRRRVSRRRTIIQAN